MKRVVTEFFDRLRGEGPPEISTGIKSLDRAIIGLRPKLYVLAGRPGMGKTALADCLRRAVVDQGYVVVQFSLEMGADELAEREIAFRAEMNLRKVMAAKEVTEDEAERVRHVADSVPKGLWRIRDDCFSIHDIQKACRQEKVMAEREKKKLGLVIIDYLQLIGDVGTEGRQQSVSACSRLTKLLQKELGCAVLVLSQLNRSCEYREDKRPMAADLRESGSIEQDADCIMFVYRDHVYNPMAAPDEAEIIIRKQRSGPIGTVYAQFHPRTVHFTDRPPRQSFEAGEIQ